MGSNIIYHRPIVGCTVELGLQVTELRLRKNQLGFHFLFLCVRVPLHDLDFVMLCPGKSLSLYFEVSVLDSNSFFHFFDLPGKDVPFFGHLLQLLVVLLELFF